MAGTKSLAVALGVLLLVLLVASPPCDGQGLTLRDVSNRYDDSRTDYRMTADKDVGRDAYELAVSKGYEAERHEVTTKDGNILQMIRIVGSPANANENGPLCPNRAQKPVVLLQHGLIDSAATWVMNMPEQSLGFVLADLGFDVWLGKACARYHTHTHDTHFTLSSDGSFRFVSSISVSIRFFSSFFGKYAVSRRPYILRVRTTTK